MRELLKFIVAHMGLLWDDARFRIVGSDLSDHNGGYASLVIESDQLRLTFTRERGELLLYFEPAQVMRPESFTVDIVRAFFLGSRETSSLLDASYASFVESHLAEIEPSFSKVQWPTTLPVLKKLEQERSKRTFG